MKIIYRASSCSDDWVSSVIVSKIFSVGTSVVLSCGGDSCGVSGSVVFLLFSNFQDRCFVIR